MSKYKDTITEEMNTLAKIPNSIFLGQQTASEDFYGTLTKVPMTKRIEMPVAEELQMGISIGLSMQGFLPVSIYQRMDFLPRAMDQLVNHLNLISQISRGIFNPKVIIRTTIGTKKPLDVGLQHSGDLTKLFKEALNFPVLRVTSVTEVRQAYKLARESKSSVMIVEEQELY